MKKNIVIAILALIVISETVYIAGFTRPKFRKRPQMVQKLSPEEAKVRKESNKLALIGMKKIRQKDLNGAYIDCTKAIQKDSTNAFAYNCRADASYRKHDFKKALEDYETILKINPNNNGIKIKIDRIKNGFNAEKK